MNSIQLEWKIKSTEVGRRGRRAAASNTWGDPEQIHNRQENPHADADYDALSLHDRGGRCFFPVAVQYQLILQFGRSL